MNPIRAKWLMNLYPPLLVSRVVVKSVSENFQLVKVVVKKSLLNRNLHGTIFGGSIFSSADPFHALMYWQALKMRGIHVQVWLKRAEIQYIKPGNTDLFVAFFLEDADIDAAVQALQIAGKADRQHETRIYNAHRELVAVVNSTVSLRAKN
jgi:acyl-coenzyme A thioesterase PaaI-like protein